MTEENKELEEKRALYLEKNEYLGNFYKEVEQESFIALYSQRGLLSDKGFRTITNPMESC